MFGKRYVRTGMEERRNQSRQRERILLIIAYVAFVSLGLPDTLVGVAWPSVRETFNLRQSDLSWIFVGAGCSYFLSSFFTGTLLKKWSVGVLLGASSALVAVSGFTYAFAPFWSLFAIGALFHGLGSGAIDTGLNHYAAKNFSARHMNWLHAFYSVGAMLGPLIMTVMITRHSTWRGGYMMVAGLLLSLATLFYLTRGRWRLEDKEPKLKQRGEVWSALKVGMVWLQIALFFIYTGIEVAIGQWSFTVLTEGRGVEKATAGLWVTVYWASILLGRLLLGSIADRLPLDLMVRASMIATLGGIGLLAWNPFGTSSVIALATCGFGLAVIFPSLMTRTPQRLGERVAAHAIGFQVGAANLGAAALPSVTGYIAQHSGLNAAPNAILVMAVMMILLHEAILLRARRKAA